jgi:peptidoglycan/xylan/chitin deacetylase (PgdA/CDA1 family)
MKFSYNPPTIIKLIFSEFIWESKIDKVLITFDDGPNLGSTEIILRELERNKIKSIFFCVGENIEKNTTLAQEILSEGHHIGNHTYKHEKITKQKNDDIIASILKVQKIAEEKLNYKIEYLRPPHGRFNLGTGRILKQLELKNVMWSLLTYDYKNDLNIVKLALEKYLHNNAIVVLHDSNKSKEIISDSIKIIIEETEKRNYKIGSPSECLKSYF